MALPSQPIRAIIATDAEEDVVQAALSRAFQTYLTLSELRWRELPRFAGSDWERVVVDPVVFATTNSLDSAPLSVVVFRLSSGDVEFTFLRHDARDGERTFSIAATRYGNSIEAPEVLGFAAANQFAQRAASFLPDSADVRVETESAAM